MDIRRQPGGRKPKEHTTAIAEAVYFGVPSRVSPSLYIYGTLTLPATTRAKTDSVCAVPRYLIRAHAPLYVPIRVQCREYPSFYASFRIKLTSLEWQLLALLVHPVNSLQSVDMSRTNINVSRCNKIEIHLTYLLRNYLCNVVIGNFEHSHFNQMS